jgi:hypothetical protein
VLASAFISYACIAGVLFKLLQGIGLSITFVSCLKITLLAKSLNYPKRTDVSEVLRKFIKVGLLDGIEENNDADESRDPEPLPSGYT